MDSTEYERHRLAGLVKGGVPQQTAEALVRLAHEISGPGVHWSDALDVMEEMLRKPEAVQQLADLCGVRR